MNILSSNYQSNVSVSTAASINSTLLSLQNPQHLSPQQQHSLSQYANQVRPNTNGVGINGTSLNANSLNQQSALQWTTDIVPQLNAFLGSNDYTPTQKSQIIHEIAQQNPTFSNLLQMINDPTFPNQLRASALNFGSPTNAAQPDLFSHLAAEATTSNATSNPLLLAQKPLVYTSQAPLDNSIVANQLAQVFDSFCRPESLNCNSANNFQVLSLTNFA
jgi:hypothetical protein